MAADTTHAPAAPLTTAPLPPAELVQRVCRIDDPDVEGTYLAQGRATRARLESLLPPGWSWSGKRVLDFGCGAGRTLRHLLDEPAELYGCDVHGPSIRWLEEHLSPPLNVVQSGTRPPLPYEAGAFDLVYALSVFTHIAEGWAGWLLELRRILRPDGILVATFMNDESWRLFGRGEWDEERTGMLVTKTLESDGLRRSVRLPLGVVAPRALGPCVRDRLPRATPGRRRRPARPRARSCCAPVPDTSKRLTSNGPATAHESSRRPSKTSSSCTPRPPSSTRGSIRPSPEGRTSSRRSWPRLREAIAGD